MTVSVPAKMTPYSTIGLWLKCRSMYQTVVGSYKAVDGTRQRSFAPVPEKL